MADVADVRAEIKAWEKAFKLENGRNASIEDIKALPHIAEKYKTYKKLTKAASASSQPSQSQVQDPPTTPPRRKSTKATTSHAQASFPSSSRNIEANEPLKTFNPFSPRKPKPTRRTPSPPPKLPPSINPFATPVKGKGKAPLRDLKRTVTPEPFPLVETEQPPMQSHPAPNTAVRRARKRLRGEPVSPSPNKSKKRRGNNQIQMVLPFKPLTSASIFEGAKPDQASSDEEETADASFVGESPVKQPTGGKSFHTLFEDMPPFNLAAAAKAGKHGSSGTSNKLTSQKIPHAKFMKSVPPAKDHKKKRRLSISDDEGVDLGADQRRQSSRSATPHDGALSGPLGLPLIPPSPPPNDPYQSKPSNPSGKGKSTQRKKAKVTATADDSRSDDTDDWEDLQSHIRLVNRRTVHNDIDDEDASQLPIVDDPVLAFTLKHQPQSDVPVVSPEGPVDTDNPPNEPNPLSRLSALHISKTHPSRADEAEEARLVQGLLYGRPRKGRLYDARRGGEIWGVGEGEDGEGLDDTVLEVRAEASGGPRREISGATTDDDDWEGEPVPWEVGEL